MHGAPSYPAVANCPEEEGCCSGPCCPVEGSAQPNQPRFLPASETFRFSIGRAYATKLNFYRMYVKRRRGFLTLTHRIHPQLSSRFHFYPICLLTCTPA